MDESTIRIQKNYRSYLGIVIISFLGSAAFFALWKTPTVIPSGWIPNEILGACVFFGFCSFWFGAIAFYSCRTFIDISGGSLRYTRPFKKSKVALRDVAIIQDFFGHGGKYGKWYLLFLSQTLGEHKPWPGWGPADLPIGLSNKLLLFVVSYTDFKSSDLVILLKAIQDQNPHLRIDDNVFKHIKRPL